MHTAFCGWITAIPTALFSSCRSRVAPNVNRPMCFCIAPSVLTKVSYPTQFVQCPNAVGACIGLSSSSPNENLTPQTEIEPPAASFKQMQNRTKRTDFIFWHTITEPGTHMVLPPSPWHHLHITKENWIAGRAKCRKVTPIAKIYCEKLTQKIV